MVFKAIDANDYALLMVTDEFLIGVSFSFNSSIDGSQISPNDMALIELLHSSVASLKLLDSKECISKYSEQFLTGRRYLLLVIDNKMV